MGQDGERSASGGSAATARGHQKLFDLQGATIVALKDAIGAVSQTDDEIATLMQADNDLEDLTGENPDVAP